MDQITNLITSIGFPMVACIVIYLDSRKDKERLYSILEEFGVKLDKFDGTLKSIDSRIHDLEKISRE